jgi:hypothetical protein
MSLPDIVFEFFFIADRVASVDLYPGSDAGARLVAAGLFRGVEGEVESGARLGSYRL